MLFDLDSVKNFLKIGNFESLLGQFENEWLECKGQPYDLSRDDQKLELAKDITGLANAGGGLLLLGYSTKRSDTHGEDQIHEIRAFPEERFNQSKYEGVLKTWVYPTLDLEISKFVVSSDSRSIIVSIHVPKVTGPNSPALVIKSIFDNTRVVETLVGYFVRKQSHVAHYDAKRIQALFRDGLRYDVDIRENFSALHTAIESLRGNTHTQATTIVEELGRDVQDALAAVQLEGKPSIVLTAVPARTLNLTGLFESNTSALVRYIESPPEVRPFGFNLNTGERSKIIRGKLRRAVEVGDKLIEVHRSGVVIFASDGGNDGLCWGRAERQHQSRLINQVVLVEFVYLFCLLCYKIFESELGGNDKFRVGVELLNLSVDGNSVRLEPGNLENFSGFKQSKPAPDASANLICDVDFSIAPERAAFLVLSEIYAWFGIEADKIPLLKYDLDEERIVDREALSGLQ